MPIQQFFELNYNFTKHILRIMSNHFTGCEAYMSRNHNTKISKTADAVSKPAAVLGEPTHFQRSSCTKDKVSGKGPRDSGYASTSSTNSSSRSIPHRHFHHGDITRHLNNSHIKFKDSRTETSVHIYHNEDSSNESNSRCLIAPLTVENVRRNHMETTNSIKTYNINDDIDSDSESVLSNHTLTNSQSNSESFSGMRVHAEYRSSRKSRSPKFAYQDSMFSVAQSSSLYFPRRCRAGSLLADHV